MGLLEGNRALIPDSPVFTGIFPNKHYLFSYTDSVLKWHLTVLPGTKFSKFSANNQQVIWQNPH